MCLGGEQGAGRGEGTLCHPPCQSRVCRKWLESVLLLGREDGSGGSVSGDAASASASASYRAVEPGCRGSSGFPAKYMDGQAP